MYDLKYTFFYYCSHRRCSEKRQNELDVLINRKVMVIFFLIETANFRWNLKLIGLVDNVFVS